MNKNLKLLLQVLVMTGLFLTSCNDKVNDRINYLTTRVVDLEQKIVFLEIKDELHAKCKELAALVKPIIVYYPYVSMKNGKPLCGLVSKESNNLDQYLTLIEVYNDINKIKANKFDDLKKDESK